LFGDEKTKLGVLNLKGMDEVMRKKLFGNSLQQTNDDLEF
jgi:hypothetical protein